MPTIQNLRRSGTPFSVALTDHNRDNKDVEVRKVATLAIGDSVAARIRAKTARS
jgi:hypothetical protein